MIAALGDAETRRYALAGLMNVCAHPPSVAAVKASDVPPLLRELAKANGIDKGVVPPAEAQQAAAILRAIDAKDAAHGASS